MPKNINIEGMKFGLLKAISLHSVSQYPSGEKFERWVCECDCGNTVYVIKKNLLNGNTQSCGCRRANSNKKRLTTHGGKGTRLYYIWLSMKDRCENPLNKNYKYYGAKGIRLCDEWHNFATFREWAIQNGYKDNLTIDRIDVHGIYEYSNCRWVDRVTQANNRSNTIYIEYNGENHTCAEWSRILGIPYDTINNRYHAGMTPCDILSTTKHKTGPKLNK